MTLLKCFFMISVCGNVGLAGCKTDSQQGEVKSLSISSDKDLTLETWTAACERDLNDPVNGSINRKDLVELTKSSDCKGAYPAIRKIVDQFSQPSAVKN